jgi:uncharacterized membrane protein YcaP (DUF421 family)
MFALETSLAEIFVRGTVVYVALAVVLRLIPKRHAGNLSPYDLIALIVVGNVASSAIIGEAKSISDILLLLVVVLGWDYAINLAEYYFPRLRRISQHTPTLLIHNGVLLKENLCKEKLTEEELLASLRKKGIAGIEEVNQAILETDGEISVIEKK